MFNLEKQNGRVTNLNIRIERHGDERQPACDIKMVVDMPSERLDDIHPGLCLSLYRKPGKGDQIALIDKKSGDAYTEVRHPLLEPLKLKQKFPGYEATISTGDEEGLFLADVEIKNFTIDPHEGGSTTITFTASSTVDRDEIGSLLEYLEGEDAVLSLVPPSKVAQDEQKEAA